MDVIYFLRERTRFIRNYYRECADVFSQRKGKIEAYETPFDNGVWDESGEPPFLEEWMEADVSIQVLGLACVSLLSDSLKLYFNTLQHRVIGFEFDEAEKKLLKRSGFVAGYQSALGIILATDWSDCPANWAIIEQVVLARNRGQHGDDLTSMRATHSQRDLTKHPRPFFARSEEVAAWPEDVRPAEMFLKPDLFVAPEALFAAIDEIEKLAEWIDSRIHHAHEWRVGQSNS